MKTWQPNNTIRFHSGLVWSPAFRVRAGETFGECAIRHHIQITGETDHHDVRLAEWEGNRGTLNYNHNSPEEL